MNKKSLKSENANLEAITIAVLLSGLFIQALTIYNVDPDGLYRPNRAKFTESALWNEMLVARYGRGDKLVLGSSLSERVNYDEFNLAMGGDVLNSAGATNLVSEQAFLLKDTVDRRQIKEVYWEMFLNLKDFTAQKPQFPSFAMNRSILDDWHYLISSAVFVRAVRTLVGGYNSKVGDFNSTRRSFSENEYGRDRPITERARLIRGWNKQKLFWDIKEDSLRESLQSVVVPLLRNYPDIKFHFVFPPAGIFALKELDRNLNKTGLSLSKFNCILVQELSQYPNAQIYNFQVEEMVKDFKEYSDALHYSEKVSTKVAIGLRSEDFRVYESTCDLHAARMTEMLKKID